jgi:hypothetical protein
MQRASTSSTGSTTRTTPPSARSNPQDLSVALPVRVDRTGSELRSAQAPSSGGRRLARPRP